MNVNSHKVSIRFWFIFAADFFWIANIQAYKLFKYLVCYRMHHMESELMWTGETKVGETRNTYIVK